MEIISAWELYWWTRLDSIVGVAELGLIVSGVSLLAITIFVVGDQTWSRYAKPLIASYLICFFLLLIALFIPSQKDMAMIYIIPKIANNEHIQQEASEIYTMAKDALQEYLPKEDNGD